MIEAQATNIFQYSDYRKYLADCYAQKKQQNAGYSHRVFAKLAGLSSPSHLLMIIKGERNLSLKTIPKFAEGLKLSAKEKRYFELMVLFNQTEDLQEKARYFGEIMALKTTQKRLHPLEKERFDFLSKWQMVAIYVLVDIKGFRADPMWIAKRLGGKITPTEAREALDTLTKLAMIEQTDGVYRQASGAITVPDDTRSLAVYQYHESMLALAARSLKRDRVQDREFNGATITIPAEKLGELKERIRAFRKEINQLASAYANPDEVYQLNIQLFSLTDSEIK